MMLRELSLAWRSVRSFQARAGEAFGRQNAIFVSREVLRPSAVKRRSTLGSRSEVQLCACFTSSDAASSSSPSLQVMLRQSLNARRIHLRESYIAISKYLHFGHARIPNRHFCCPRDGIRRTRLSKAYPNTFCTLQNLGDRPRLPQDKDITQGFPEPPQPGPVPDASEENGKTHALGSNRPLEESLSSGSGPDVPFRRILIKDHGISRSNDSTGCIGSQESPIGADGDHVQRRRYPHMGRFTSKARLSRL